MNRLFASLFLLGCFTTTVVANDASMVGIGGSVTPQQGKHPSVQMVYEVVNLDLYKDHYETRVTFNFKNTGDATKVVMGFPERGFGIDGGDAKAAITNFTSTVDSIPVTTRRVVAAKNNDAYQAYWIKTVPFTRHQAHKVFVSFQSPYGGGLGGRLVGYDFTGGNWHGKVHASALKITVHEGAPTLPIAAMDGKPVELTEMKGVRTHTWVDWNAQGRFVLSEKR